MKSRDSKKIRRIERIEDKKRKEEKKRTAAVIAFIGVFLAAVISVIYFSMPHYVSIKSKDGKYYDKKNKITYIAAPMNYEPVSVTQKAYAKLDGKYFLYPVTGKRTSEWLAEDYYGIYSLYYSDGVSLPTLEEMDADKLIICSDGVESVVGLATVTDKKELKTILDTIENGEPVEIPEGESRVYTLRFTSESYSWIYYDIVYVITENGCYYYDRGLQRSVAADDTLVSYLDGNELPD